MRRLMPLAVLVTLTLTALVIRGRRAPTRTSSPPEPVIVDAGPTLRGSDFDAQAPVAAHAARMLHGDAHHTHRAHGHGPKAAKLAWATSVGGAIEAQVVASPDERTLYVASLDGSLTALGRDGAKRWSVPLGDRVYTTPCVADDGTVYVGSDAKRMHAVTPEGRIAWKLEVDGDADTSAAISRDGSIVFAAGARMYAVRPGGAIAWIFPVKKKIFTAPAMADDGSIVFGAQDHFVYALSPSGALAWSVDLGADVDASPAIGDDGAIFVGTDADEVVRLDSAGHIAWRTKVGGFVRGALSVARNGDVLAGVYGPTPRQIRIRPDGAVVGSFAVQGTGAREFGVHGGALEDDDGALFFGAQDNDVIAVSPSGSVAWRYATGGDVDAPLTLLGTGELIAASDDGKVYLFSP